MQSSTAGSTSRWLRACTAAALSRAAARHRDDDAHALEQTVHALAQGAAALRVDEAAGRGDRRKVRGLAIAVLDLHQAIRPRRLFSSHS